MRVLMEFSWSSNSEPKHDADYSDGEYRPLEEQSFTETQIPISQPVGIPVFGRERVLFVFVTDELLRTVGDEGIVSVREWMEPPYAPASIESIVNEMPKRSEEPDAGIARIEEKEKERDTDRKVQRFMEEIPVFVVVLVDLALLIEEVDEEIEIWREGGDNTERDEFVVCFSRKNGCNQPHDESYRDIEIHRRSSLFPPFYSLKIARKGEGRSEIKKRADPWFRISRLRCAPPNALLCPQGFQNIDSHWPRGDSVEDVHEDGDNGMEAILLLSDTHHASDFIAGIVQCLLYGNRETIQVLHLVQDILDKRRDFQICLATGILYFLAREHHFARALLPAFPTMSGSSGFAIIPIFHATSVLVELGKKAFT